MIDLSSVPVLDLTVPHADAVSLVNASLRRFGFFYVQQHGVDEALIDEAAAIFFDGAPFASLQQPGEPRLLAARGGGRHRRRRVAAALEE